jgi:Na+-translocating ferredoxin:NAD+ oxidoreductase subunit B
MDKGEVYRRLGRHLDRMPVGFPATASGVELRILEQLFSAQEAEIALELSAIPEPLSTIHRRLRQRLSRAELAAALEAMAARGAIHRAGAGARPRYGKLMFAVGMYELQIGRLTERFARDSRQYMEEGFAEAFTATRTTQLRTVPINAKISFERTVARHDDILEYARHARGPFAAMDCICRKGQDLVGEPCRTTKLRENCLTLGPAAKGMVRRGSARFIQRAELLRLLEVADAEGLVLQPQNTTRPQFICCCCGCCCSVLAMARRRPEPATAFTTSYRAAVDASACQGCSVCVARCPMGAVRVEGDAAVVANASCIGCGLCATGCPSKAVRLVSTASSSRPPETMEALYLKLFRERFGAWGVAKAATRRLLGLKI